jgi:hypothetical protein
MEAEPPEADPPKRKRRWFQFSLRTLFVVVTVAAAVAAWLFAAETYTASALIRIAAEPPKVMASVETRSNSELYKSTQIQLLTSDFVLISALRNIGQLEIVKQQNDPVRWLAKTLQLESPGNAEILRVSLTAPQKNDAVAIVNAVVAAYMNEVVDRERSSGISKLAELDKVFTEKETELRAKLTELNKLSETLESAGQIENRRQPRITVLAQLAAESRRAEMQAELQIAHLKHDMNGLDKESARFKTAKAEADLAEVDREFWSSKSVTLTEELEKAQTRLDRKSTASIDVEMMRGEVKSLKALTRAVNDERERVRIELHSQPRITVMQPAL